MSFSEWREVNLGDIAIFSQGKQVPISKQYPEKDKRMIRFIRIVDFTKEDEPPRFIHDPGEEFHVTSKDIVMIRYGSKTAGKVVRGYDGVIANNMFKISFISDKIDKNFAYYLLGNDSVYNRLNRSQSSSTMPAITFGMITKYKIKLPPLEEQKSIANILSTLDEKIEVNNQINKTLEEMAQAIFKQWFVDFEFANENGEPYKSSGGEMVESELGMIPKGWEVGVFRDYVETILGGDWGKEFSHGNYIKEVYCLRGADIPEVRVGKKGALPKRFILEKNYNNKKLKNGDLVVEISGGSPTQSTGRITYITEDLLNKYDSDFVCTNFCRAITLENKQAMEYFFFYWQQLYDQNVFFQYENGTTGIKNLDINTFIDTFQIIKPNKMILEKYHKMIGILLKKIQINGDEIIKLTEIRDTLLPKLMSGEIRVPLND